MSYDAEQSILSRMRTVVSEHGDRIAIGTGRWQPTYSEFDTTANGLAHQLIAHGVKPGDCVAILMRHDGPQLAALLGVLKAGATAAALNRTDPPGRLGDVIAATGATHLVVSDQTRELAASVWSRSESVVHFEPERTAPTHAPAIDVSSRAMAFLVYTSGSSGRPKVVMQPHRFVLHNALRHALTQRLQVTDRIALIASISGSQGMGTTWSALASGVTLYLHATMEVGVASLPDWINEHRITVHVSASSVHRYMMKTLPADLRFPSVRLLQLTSEWATSDDFHEYERHFLPGCEFIHAYGSSESGNATRLRLRHGDLVPAGRLVLGEPSEGMELLVVDEAGQTVPPGTTGELMVRSRFLTAGYWRDETLTRQRYTLDSATGVVSYRGGDLARVSGHGLEFMGRKDAAVKVGGFYVDPFEVEQGLLRLPGVERTAVVPWTRPNGEAVLVAYLMISNRQMKSAEAIRKALRDTMPRYMVPPIIRFPDDLPLTAQGKIDRVALRQDQPVATGGQGAPPATPTELLVADAWADEFELERVGRDDNFFDLGGDSLIASVVAARVQEAVAVDMTLALFFEHPTLADFASAIDRLAAENRVGLPPIEPVPRDAPLPLSFEQERVYAACTEDAASAASYVTRRAYRVLGALDAGALAECMNVLVRRHEMLRTTFAQRDGRPVQIVHAPFDMELPVTDLRGSRSPEEAAQELWRREQTWRPDLASTPLFRFGLYRVGDNEHWMVRSSQHLIFDERAWPIFFRELGELYSARMAGRPQPLPDRKLLDFGDYAVWQRQHLHPGAPAYRAALAWWKKQLSPRYKDWELSFRRRKKLASVSPELGFIHAAIGSETVSRIESLRSSERVTDFVILLAALATIIASDTGRRDLVIGSYVSNRRSAAAQDMFGYFANLVALRVRCDPQMTFRTLLAQTSRVVSDSYAASHITYEDLVRRLNADGVASPVVKVIAQIRRDEDFTLGNITGTVIERENSAMPWGLSLILAADSRRLDAWFDAGAYDPAGAQRFLDDMVRLLGAAARNPDSTMGQLQPQLAAPRWQRLADALTLRMRPFSRAGA